MRFPHPQYGKLAFSDRSVISGRWHVAGSGCAVAVVEEFVAEGLSAAEIVERAFFLEARHLPVVTEIARLHRAYLVDVGRLAA